MSTWKEGLPYAMRDRGVGSATVRPPALTNVAYDDGGDLLPAISGLLLIGTRPPPIGGVSMHVDRLCRALDGKGVAYTHCDARRIGLRATFAAVSRHRVCHINLSHPLLILLLTACAALLGKSSIVTVHGDLDRYVTWRRFCLRLAVAMATVPIFLNDSSYRGGQRLNRRAIRLSAFIPPCEAETLEEDLVCRIHAKAPQYERVIVTNASHYVIDALGREVYGVFSLIEFLAERNFLLLVSDPSGQYEAAARLRYSDLQLSHVVFLSRPHSFIAALSYADVCVRNTTTDGDSLSVHEALYSRKPVWASAVVSRPSGVYLYRELEDIDWWAPADAGYSAPRVVEELVTLYAELVASASFAGLRWGLRRLFRRAP